MKRLKIELWSVGFAFAVMALFADHGSECEPLNSKGLTAKQARVEAAPYLEATPTAARLDRVSQRWQVTDGRATAWIDAYSGQLLEVRFEARSAKP